MRLTLGAAFFPPRPRKALPGYAMAVASISTVIVLTLLFWRPLGKAIPVALVFFAITVTSWYSGRKAGFLAAILGLIATDIVVSPDAQAWTNFFLYSRLFSFTLLALMVSGLRDAVDRYRRDQDRLLELERTARAAAEESARLHQQVEDRLTVLVEASGALLTSLESKSVVTRIMDLAQRFVAADAYAVWRRDEPTKRWEVVSAEGLSDDYRRRFNTGMQDVRLETREVIAVEDVGSDPLLEARRDLYESEGIRSLLVIALPVREGAPGAISFYYRSPHQFGRGDVRVALALANLAGSALLIAELYEEQMRLRAGAQAANEALQHSNEELQQFAYVVSHDLQEPLRMIASYTNLLQKRYDSTFDQDGHEFMEFIVDGANRMQRMIRDLLAYSRVVNTADRPQSYVALDSVLDDALLNLRAAIEKEAAVITRDRLPHVFTDRSQMLQLVQNLVGNALKYRRDEPPRIHIGAEQRNKEWIFSVRDNGIGLESRHFDRIFGIFKRVHGQEYTGTGIGLAIAKRVVETHRGHIWVDSTIGQGSTFFFSLPADIVSAEGPLAAAD